MPKFIIALALLTLNARAETAEDRYAERRWDQKIAHLMRTLQPQFNRELREIERHFGGRIVSPKGFRIRDQESHRVILANGKTCVVMGGIEQTETTYVGRVFSWDCY